MGRRRSKWKDQQNNEKKETLLLSYAKAGDIESLDNLLETHFPSSSSSVSFDNNESVQHARKDFLQLTQDHMGSTALHLASMEGHVELVKYLLEHGAGEIHLCGGRKKYAKTPLHEASIYGRLQVCQVLVEYGFLVDCHTTRGRTPLMYAVKGNFIELVEYFLKKCHANVNEQNEMGVTPVYIASQEGHLEMVQLLARYGADLNLCNRTRHSPLHEAVAGGFLQVVAFLIENGADKQAVDAMGVTIWHEAAGHGSVEMLELLLKYQVQLATSKDEAVDKVMARHPFHYAAVEGKAAFVKAMIDKNLVDPNLQDADGCTAIYYAAANGHVDVLQVLLISNADPNVVSIRRSPLHCAVEWNRLECVELLLKHGADAVALDKDGKTPIEIAHGKKFQEILSCFDTINSTNELKP